MKDINCPRCNSVQSFNTQTRTNEETGDYEAFVRCSLCKWEVVVFAGTRREYKIRKDLVRLRAAHIRGAPVQRRIEDRQRSLKVEIRGH